MNLTLSSTGRAGKTVPPSRLADVAWSREFVLRGADVCRFFVEPGNVLVMSTGAYDTLAA
jgi:hypothetical protein